MIASHILLLFLTTAWADPEPVDEPAPEPAVEEPVEPMPRVEQVLDETPDNTMSLELNSILVATFEAEQPFLEAETQRVHGLVESALAQRYLVVTMAEVEPFNDSDAEVYLRSCPDGQYIGCVFVVGGRAQTDWTIGGRLRAVDGGYQVFLSLIDVDVAKLVTEFDVTLDGSNDLQFQAGVLDIVDAALAGDLQQLDPQTAAEKEAAEQEEEDERTRSARKFATDATYDDPFDGVDDEREDETDEPEEKGKVTSADLDAMEDRGGRTPWDRVGLTRGQYKLYRNSGVKLRDFKDRLKGRKGELLFRLSGNVGPGPWGQRHDTFYKLAEGAQPGALKARDIADQRLVQSQTIGLSYGGQFEVGLGVTPWMELGVFGGLRAAPYEHRFYRQQEGDTSASSFQSSTALSMQVGARLGFIPLPAYPVRPTFHVGGSMWIGSALGSVAEVPAYLLASQLRPNNLLLVHVQPGAEVSVGRSVALWTRFDFDLPVLGRNIQQGSRGDGSLVGAPEAVTAGGPALGGSLGILIRLRVGPDRR